MDIHCNGAFLSEDRFWKWDCGSRVLNILCFYRYQKQDLNLNMSASKAQESPRMKDGSMAPGFHPGLQDSWSKWPGASCLGCRDAGVPAWQEPLAVDHSHNQPHRGHGASESRQQGGEGCHPHFTVGVQPRLEQRLSS